MSTKRVVSLVFLAQVMSSICYYLIYAAVPVLKDAYALSGARVGLVLTAATLGYAVFLIPLGALTDRYGESRLLPTGLSGMAVGVIIVSQTKSYLSLIAAVFIVGAFYGTASPGTNKAIFDRVPPRRQNVAVGIKQVGVTVGSAISTLLITTIVSFVSWRIGFYLVTVLGVLTAGLFSGLYRSSNTRESTYPKMRILLTNQKFLTLIAGGLFLGASLFTTMGYTILYIEEVLGGSLAIGGLILASVQVTGSIGRIASGWFSDIVSVDSDRVLPLILLIQTVVSSFLFVVIAGVQTVWIAAGVFTTLGFFVLGYTGIYFSYLGTLVPTDDIGGASSIGQLALTVGALVAPPVFGYVGDIVSYRAAWTLLAVTSGIAAIFIGIAVWTNRDK